MRLTVDLAPMPPAVQAAVRQLLEALVQAWPPPGHDVPVDAMAPREPSAVRDRQSREAPPARGLLSFQRAHVMECLRQRPEGMTSAEICAECKDIPNIPNMLSHMTRLGLIVRVERGRYAVRE